MQRLAIVSAIFALVITGWLTDSSVHAQLPGQLPGVEPLHDNGQDVTPAFEGWFKNPDGTFDITLGYNNRNLKEEIDIPIGPNNKIEPGGPDQGQPTHFMPRRGWGVFTVTVPKDFGTKKITWIRDEEDHLDADVERPHQRDSGRPGSPLGNRRDQGSDRRQHPAGAGLQGGRPERPGPAGVHHHDGGDDAQCRDARHLGQRRQPEQRA
jgi:hypothetical protein